VSPLNHGRFTDQRYTGGHGGDLNISLFKLAVFVYRFNRLGLNEIILDIVIYLMDSRSRGHNILDFPRIESSTSVNDGSSTDKKSPSDCAQFAEMHSTLLATWDSRWKFFCILLPEDKRHSVLG